ncbi:MAG: hypothetical protein ACP5IZ_07185 [Thermoprotei archaeon]
MSYHLNKKIIFLISIIAIMMIVFNSAQIITAQQQNVSVDEILTVNEVGDAHYELTAKFTLSTYMQVKQTYGTNPYLLVRSLRAHGKGIISAVNVNFNDADNSLKITFNVAGIAVNKKAYWEIYLGKDVKLTVQSGTTLVFSSTTQSNFGQTLITTKIILPEGPGNIQYDSDTGYIRYTLPSSIINDDNRLLFSGIFLGLAVISGGYTFILFRRSKKPYYPPYPYQQVPQQPPQLQYPQQSWVQQPVPQQVQPSEAYKFCINCGAKIPITAKVCPFCNVPQE